MELWVVARGRSQHAEVTLTTDFIATGDDFPRAFEEGEPTMSEREVSGAFAKRTSCVPTYKFLCVVRSCSVIIYVNNFSRQLDFWS